MPNGRGAVLAMVLTLAGCHSNPPKTPATTAAPAPAAAPAAEARWYEKEIAAFEAADRAHPPAAGQVLFVGSSSIRLWPKLAEAMAPAPVLQRGFGGSKTGEVLEVFDRIVTPCRPGVIVYYCGDNDLGTDNHDAEGAARGFTAFDRRARALWPGVRVLYIAIKPSVARWSNWPAMRRANEIVREYCEKTPGAGYLDIASPMLEPSGLPDPALFQADGLHLNAAGYAVWEGVVRPRVLEAWRAAEGKP